MKKIFTTVATVATPNTVEYLNIYDEFTKVILPKVFNIVLALLVGYFIIRIVNNQVKKWIERTKINPVFHGIFRQVIKIIMFVILFGYILDILSIPLTPFATVFASIGLALSLSIKDTVSDVASGVIILANKYFDIGDYVEIGTSKGIVTKITLGYVKLTTPDRTEIFIPNSTITKSSVYNHSGKPNRRLDERFVVGNYQSINDTKEMFLFIINSSNMVVIDEEDNGPKVYVESFTEENTTYLIKVWVNQKDYIKMSYYLNEEIKKQLEKIKAG